MFTMRNALVIVRQTDGTGRTTAQLGFYFTISIPCKQLRSGFAGKRGNISQPQHTETIQHSETVFQSALQTS